MKRIALGILALVTLVACVPDAKQNIHNQNPSVTLSGGFVSLGGTTKIYFGNEISPLLETGSSASFTVKVPRSVIEASHDRHLYFYSSNGEAAVSNEITDYETGTKLLPTLTLAPEILLSGSILSGTTPVPGAKLSVGRSVAMSLADGTYTLRAPVGAPLPVALTKSGYVITKAFWSVSVAETRNFHLYSSLAPTGSIHVPVSNRILMTMLPLSLENTEGAAYVRISASAFNLTPEQETAWLPLNGPISIPTAVESNPVLYYQFANSNKSVVGEVLTLNTNAEAL
ncbi:MAG: hypothetical protein H7249_04905 [Chitinophagaceae bacterium]|nr:hypothetical protein [Oligoflexus sp.]